MKKENLEKIDKAIEAKAAKEQKDKKQREDALAARRAQEEKYREKAVTVIEPALKAIARALPDRGQPAHVNAAPISKEITLNLWVKDGPATFDHGYFKVKCLENNVTIEADKEGPGRVSYRKGPWSLDDVTGEMIEDAFTEFFTDGGTAPD